jgi:CheY-like chemotaxis protein
MTCSTLEGGRPGRNGVSNKIGLSACTSFRLGRLGAGHSAGRGLDCQHVNMRPTVLIVDDHPGFRASARALLEAEGFDVVGEAADGEQAVREVGRLRPDVVLLDVQLPDVDGFAVADRLASEGGAAAIVLISSREAAAYGPRLEAAAARGFIAKRQLSGEALAALLV